MSSASTDSAGRVDSAGSLQPADPAVRVIVLTHTGPVFCSGMDLKESAAPGTGDQGVTELPRILETLWSSGTPVIARLAGPARAGGIGLLAACDLVMVTAAHTNVDYELVAEFAPLIFDTKNAMKNVARRDNIRLL